MTARTQEEILARYQDITRAETDWMGFRREALAALMDGATLKKTGDYTVGLEHTIEASDPVVLLGEYFEFACGKASDHRGISAGRSIDKLTEYAWAAGFDDAVTAIDAAGYENYGAPKLYALSECVDTLTWPVDDEALHRMSLGQPCNEDCQSGCGM